MDFVHHVVTPDIQIESLKILLLTASHPASEQAAGMSGHDLMVLHIILHRDAGTPCLMRCPNHLASTPCRIFDRR